MVVATGPCGSAPVRTALAGGTPDTCFTPWAAGVSTTMSAPVFISVLGESLQGDLRFVVPYHFLDPFRLLYCAFYFENQTVSVQQIGSPISKPRTMPTSV
jgi:hypothetical protein